MNILYVENDTKIVNLIAKEIDKLEHEFFLLEEPTTALNFLKNTDCIDLIITEINFPKWDDLKYLEKIRSINKKIIIVIISNFEINASFEEFINLNISKFIKKPFGISYFKEIIKELEDTRFKYNEILKLKEDQINLKKLNMELLSFLKPFKEFSFYSETDLNGIITEISDSYSTLVGYKKEELLGQKHSIFKHPLESSLKYVEIWQNITKGKTWVGELRCKDRFGNDIWYKSIIFPKKNINGVIVGYGAKRQDITDKKIAELQSITDDLTNLYNKRFFKQIFSSERNRAKRNKKNLVLLILDIDNFKKYNDTYGHFEGDRALKKVASIIRNNAKRANDFVFRLGGEEFALITSNLSVDKIMKYSQKIRESIFNQKIIHKNNADIGFITVSIGVFNLEIKDNYSCDEIYKFADIALYRAKNLGRNKVVIFK